MNLEKRNNEIKARITEIKGLIGAEVTLVERHPVLFTLLEDAHRMAMDDAFLNKAVSRIQLVFSDSAHYLEQQAKLNKVFDVVYLDPMFPQRDQNQQAEKKQAQVKKQMQCTPQCLLMTEKYI